MLHDPWIEGALTAEHIERRLRGSLSRLVPTPDEVAGVIDSPPSIPVLELDQVIDAYRALTDQLVATSATANRIVRALLDESLDRERGLHRLVAERDRLQRALDLQERAVTDLHTALEGRDQVIAATRSALNERERNLAASAAEKEGLHQTVRAGEQALAEKQAHLEASQRHLARVDAARGRLQKTLERREQAITQMRTALAARDRDLVQAVAERDRIQQAVEQRDKVIAELRSALESRTQDLTQVTSDRDVLQRQLRLRDDVIAELQTALQAQQQDVALPNFDVSAEDAWPSADAEPALNEFLRSQDDSDGAEETDRLYSAIELVLRGSEGLIRERQVQYLPYLNVPQQIRELPIVDIGCGRGEFLSLLRERGIPAIGVDLHAPAIARLREQGYDAHHADGADYLEGLPDASLAGITAFQVIEHWEYGYLLRFLRLAHAKLAPGGLILLETPNPDCLTCFRSFYLDPTHHKPIPKYLLAILARFYGIQNLNVLYQNPISSKIAAIDQDQSRFYQTYAILGSKPAEQRN
jgi:SAM-dependent methyltransferase